MKWCPVESFRVLRAVRMKAIYSPIKILSLEIHYLLVTSYPRCRMQPLPYYLADLEHLHAYMHAQFGQAAEINYRGKLNGGSKRARTALFVFWRLWRKQPLTPRDSLPCKKLLDAAK